MDSTADRIYKYMKKHPDTTFIAAELSKILKIGNTAIKGGIQCLRNRHMINSCITTTSRQYWYDEIYEKNN